LFPKQGLTQDYIEKKLQAAFQVITNSPDLSKNCAQYAIPAICLSTLPLCDSQTQRPRKVRKILYILLIHHPSEKPRLVVLLFELAISNLYFDRETLLFLLYCLLK
jgi:hypothetical protein